MPINKNAITRFRVLDRCFRNHYKKYYIENLIEECAKELGTSVSRKTIFNDINYMEGAYDIELNRITDGKRVFYRYNDPNSSITNSPLSAVEIAQLKSAINVLSQFRGLPQFEWLDDIVDKLKLSSYTYAAEIVGFDTNIDLKGRSYIGEIYQYIINKVVLKIEYWAFSWVAPRTVTLHPQYLKQYNNRWFVFGYNSDLEIPGWNMALDRICSIDIAEGVTYRQSSICWEEYFEDIIGVTNYNDSPVEEVILHCYGDSGKYIETKLIHSSQRQRWLDEECLQVKLYVKLNFELESFILGQGNNVKVVSPQVLKEKIKSKISAMKSLYE